MRLRKPLWRWFATVVVLLLLGSALAVWRIESGSGIYTDGFSSEQPTPVQLSAMANWYHEHVAPGFFAGVPGRFGCVVYSMATRRLSTRRSVAYTQVMCQQCPPSHLGGFTPTVFYLDRSSVTSSRAVTAAGDPGYFDEIKKYFPQRMWDGANSPTISASDVDLYVAAAYEVAGCGK